MEMDLDVETDISEAVRLPSKERCLTSRDVIRSTQCLLSTRLHLSKNTIIKTIPGTS